MNIHFFASNLLAQEKQMTSKYKKNTIKKVSLLIKQNYVLKFKRDSIADQIVKVLNEGSYKKVKDFESFGQQLTNDLHEISGDHHFAVVYDPSRVAEMRNENEEQPKKEEIEESQKRKLEKRKRNNFGFRKIEILDGNIGYLDFRFFRGDSLALETARSAMAFLSNSDALIIDLRKNQGGGVAMFQLLSSYFFGDKPILLGEIYNGLSDETQQIWTKPDIARYKIPAMDLYILTSKETFSAAEEFAYDLKQLKRATIVGENTGGGAHMATRMIINDGFYILMPFAGAINPITKTNWEGVGVIPDIKTVSEDALKTAHIMALKKIINKASNEEYKKDLEILLKNLEK